MEKVSIIIAAYNIEDYIERCLISCMNQTFQDSEIIVVNDGSTDSTLEWLSIQSDIITITQEKEMKNSLSTLKKTSV